ncbi:MAG: hypothetical protein ACLFWL_17080, partial [Candidatus Brocadiia bacterium]
MTCLWASSVLVGSTIGSTSAPALRAFFGTALVTLNAYIRKMQAMIQVWRFRSRSIQDSDAISSSSPALKQRHDLPRKSLADFNHLTE